jgi:hypothetical protein
MRRQKPRTSRIRKVKFSHCFKRSKWSPLNFKSPKFYGSPTWWQCSQFHWNKRKGLEMYVISSCFRKGQAYRTLSLQPFFFPRVTWFVLRRTSPLMENFMRRMIASDFPITQTGLTSVGWETLPELAVDYTVTLTAKELIWQVTTFMHVLLPNFAPRLKQSVVC